MDHLQIKPTDQLGMIKEVFALQKQNLPALNQTSLSERLAKLRAIEQFLMDNGQQEKLKQAMFADFRKPGVEVMISEVSVVLQQIRHVKKNLRRWLQPELAGTPLPLMGTKSYNLYEAKGNCLIIAPWNYPLNLSIAPLVYAIAGGNASIIKPSEMTPHTSAFVQEMVESLFPAQEVAVFQGDKEVAQALLELPFNHIHFTGSPQVGKIIMKAAAEHLASVTLELGGKSPAIVDRTAPIRTTAEKTAWGKFFNNGQTCIAPDYLLIEESVKDEFVSAFKEVVERMYDPAGKGIAQSPDYSRIVNDRHFKRIKHLIEDAVAKGAKVLTGAEFDETDRFIAPTLLDNVTEEMDIMKEEIFGPVLPIRTFQSRGDIIRTIKARPKPLSMYIASRNRSFINQIIDETSAGGTVINDYLLGYSNPDLSFGGINNSGIGRAFGKKGFEEFVNARAIIKRQFGTFKMVYPPYTSGVKRIVAFITKWL
jgi:aldehyde dehydrogenase (NAD+)